MATHPGILAWRIPMDSSPTRLLCPRGFSRQEYLSGLPCPPPGDLPNPGIESRSPALQVDSLSSEPLGKPKNTGVDSLSLLRKIFPTQESNQALLHCRQILYQLSYQRSLVEGLVMVKSNLSPCKALAFAWGPEKGVLFP